MENSKILKRPAFFEAIQNMGWFSRLSIIGAILLVIDSSLELLTSPLGLLSLIFSIIVLFLSTQIQDDNPSAYFHAIIILILNYIVQIYLHQSTNTNWVVGLGFIGYILINATNSLVLILIIISVGASVNKDPVDDKRLFIFGLILQSLNLLVFLVLNNWILTATSMLAIFYLALIMICIVLALLEQKLMGGLIIFIISVIIIAGEIINHPLSSTVTGFGAGAMIIGMIAGMNFLNELGFLLTADDKKKI